MLLEPVAINNGESAIRFPLPLTPPVPVCATCAT